MSILEEYAERAARNRERYSKWEPRQNAREKTARGIRYLICTDGTTYMMVPRKQGRRMQLIRVTRKI